MKNGMALRGGFWGSATEQKRLPVVKIYNLDEHVSKPRHLIETDSQKPAESEQRVKRAEKQCQACSALFGTTLTLSGID